VLANSIAKGIYINTNNWPNLGIYPEEIYTSFDIVNAMSTEGDKNAALMQSIADFGNKFLLSGMEKKKYYSKQKIPEVNEVYKVKKMIKYEGEFIMYILEKTQILSTDLSVFRLIDKPELKGISLENQINIYLSNQDKTANLILLLDYLEKIKDRINAVFKYYLDSQRKTIYATSIVEMFRKIFVRLSNSNDKLSLIFLITLSDLFFSICNTVIASNTVSKSDIVKLEEMPEKLDSYIKIFNSKIGSTQQIDDIDKLVSKLEVYILYFIFYILTYKI
jgi:hypothetical protein